MSCLRKALLACSMAVAFLVLAAVASAATPVTCASPTSTQSEPTEYFVSLTDPTKHLAHVSIRLREGDGVRTLEMPVWNALYQVRNFAANIEDVRAQDASGGPAAVFNRKTSEWEITAPPGCVVVSYGIHLDSPGPFGSALNPDHAFFNWAMVLMYSPALRSLPVSIRLLDIPTTWGLQDLHVLGAAAPGKVDQNVGIASNYDALADSPAELGVFQQSTFRE